MHGDFPAACPCSAARAARSATSSHACSRSASDPSVAITCIPIASDLLGVGPGGRDQRFAAIGQHQQQLQDPVPPHPAQHLQRPALQADAAAA